MDATRFGCFVADQRKKQGMTQKDLAAKIQVTDKAVSKWERGLGFPDINTVEDLADALGVSIEELMKLTGKDRTETERIISRVLEVSFVVDMSCIKNADDECNSCIACLDRFILLNNCFFDSVDIEGNSRFRMLLTSIIDIFFHFLLLIF